MKAASGSGLITGNNPLTIGGIMPYKRIKREDKQVITTVEGVRVGDFFMFSGHHISDSHLRLRTQDGWVSLNSGNHYPLDDHKFGKNYRVCVIDDVEIIH
jgi:hypothetical protein